MTKAQQHKNVCDQLTDIYISKNEDYGNSFERLIDEYGLVAAAIHLDEKLSRFKTLIKNEEPRVKGESIDDSILDLANYAIMTYMIMNPQKGIQEIIYSDDVEVLRFSHEGVGTE